MKQVGMALILALVVMVAVNRAGAAGSWTTPDRGSKPGLTLQGSAKKSNFDTAKDKIGNRPAKEVWVGAPGSGPTIQAAVAAIGSKVVRLRVPAGIYPFTTNLVIPANVILCPEPGAVMTRVAGDHLTVNSLLCGAWQCFNDNSPKGDWVVLGSAVTDLVPEWWGAKGDDATNDTRPLQQAFKAGGGKRLRLDKVYKTNYPLKTPAHTQICGPGTIHMSVTGPCLYPGNYNTIRDLTLKGTYGKHPGAWAISALYLGGDPGRHVDRNMGDADWQGTHLTVDNVKMEDFGHGGIVAGPYSTMINCTITHCYFEGILMLGDGCRVENNRISRVSSWGLDVCASSARLIGNSLTECGDYATLGHKDGGGILVNSAFLKPGVSQCVVAGNRVNGSDFNGIQLFSQHYPMSQIVVRGNLIKDVDRNLTHLAGAIAIIDAGAGFTGVLVEDNSIDSPGAPNLFQNVPQAGVVIRNNPGPNPTR
jgi:hypothetical protein